MQRFLFLKLAAIAALGVLLLIPMAMIAGQVSDRSHFRGTAKAGVAESWTGAQKLVGPLVAVEYTRVWSEKVWDRERQREVIQEHAERERLYLLPKRLKLSAEVATDVLHRGIFPVPVYTGAMAVSGEVDLAPLEALRQRADVREVGAPVLALHVHDPRGIAAVPELTWGEARLSFEPGSGLPGLDAGIHAPLPADAGGAAFGFALKLRGMERLEFVPVGESTEVALASPWPHPSFFGRYLPQERRIGAEGFTARWEATRFATGIERQLSACAAGHCDSLASNTFGVSLMDPVDVYLQTERSVKYGVLFVGLTFVAFFLFEVLTGRRVHPLQYLLVGLALSLFYLLLLSLAEHVAFGWAYLAATVACVGLIGYYLRYVLGSRAGAAGFAAALAGVYGALYVIIRSEDHALLMGSGLLFLVLAGVMVLTRRLDWYAVGEQVQQAVRPRG